MTAKPPAIGEIVDFGRRRPALFILIIKSALVLVPNRAGQAINSEASMINRECIYKTIKEYLPTAGEDLLAYLTTQAERQIELQGKDIIRKVVLQRETRESAFFTSRIDTKV